MNKSRLLVIVIIAAAVVAFFALGLHERLSLDNLQAQHDQLLDYRDHHPVLLTGGFFAFYVLVTALSLPGATIMTLAAGAVFGLVWGTLVVSFASSLGATLAFLVSRLLLHDWVQARFGRRLRAINEGVRKDGAFYLFTLRLVPVFPFFVINAAMGLTPLRTWTFYWVSQVGMLAGTVVYVNAGTQLAQIQSVGDILSPGLIGSFALLGLFPLLARWLVGWLGRRKVYRGWRRPARFDRNVVVIGAGSAGLVSAYIAGAVKAKVTLVEKHRMGGDCLNTGCVPSKALIRAARLAHDMGRAGEFGLGGAPPEVDFAAVMERVQRVIRDIEPHDSVARYTDLGVDVMEGSARLVSPWEVEVTRPDGGTRRLTTRTVVIAAGARPLVPPIPGIEDMDYLTSDTLWELRTSPGRLLVLGGGPIGCELAQAFARLGVAVTQVERSPRILSREDLDVSRAVAAGLEADGVELLVDHDAVAFRREGEGRILVARRGDEEREIAFDTLLVGVGREANLKGYGLEELGIPTGRTIETNAFLQTVYPNIYAAGDVAGPYQFTHTAAHQAWYAAVNALFDPLKKFRVNYDVIPHCTFVDPEAARVGLNEQEARQAEVPYEVTTYGIDDLDRAIADGAASGFVKVLTVPGKDRILGVSIVGSHAGELLAEWVLAMGQGIGLNKILGTIHVYPTLAEANKYAAGRWKQAHAPQGVLRWLGRFHAWRRG